LSTDFTFWASAMSRIMHHRPQRTTRLFRGVLLAFQPRTDWEQARGPGLAKVDLAVQRNFRIGNDNRLELRIEVFNLLNRANFFQPGRVFGSPGYGVITGALDPRDVQLGVKYSF